MNFVSSFKFFGSLVPIFLLVLERYDKLYDIEDFKEEKRKVLTHWILYFNCWCA